MQPTVKNIKTKNTIWTEAIVIPLRCTLDLLTTRSAGAGKYLFKKATLEGKILRRARPKRLNSFPHNIICIFKSKKAA